MIRVAFEKLNPKKLQKAKNCQKYKNQKSFEGLLLN